MTASISRSCFLSSTSLILRRRIALRILDPHFPIHLQKTALTGLLSLPGSPALQSRELHLFPFELGEGKGFVFFNHLPPFKIRKPD